MFRFEKCQHRDVSAKRYPCVECDSAVNDLFEPKKPTNAERNRSMSDEELAEFLIKIDGCLANAGKVDCSQAKECGICEDVIKKWLQSEVEE